MIDIFQCLLYTFKFWKPLNTNLTMLMEHYEIRNRCISDVIINNQGRMQEGVWGFNPPTIDLSTKMHNKENITFLALLSLFFFAMKWTPT